ncbi:heavy-metal-associated domain-containing protein [bacterium SCSIO 12741]|nr:heavy-metal-associated domain-containing protein [bacterium SCSIO 12741]
MKQLIVLGFLLMSFQLWSQEDGKFSTAEFKVEGVCGMCEGRIEEAANYTKGVKISDWDKETKMIKVTYNAKKVSPEEIGKSIAKAGYTNDYAKAESKDYSKLPGCCRYEEVEDH